MVVANAPLAFHIMAKPTGSACNLNCAYCFFLKKEALYPDSDFRMSDEVHETLCLPKTPSACSYGPQTPLSHRQPSPAG